MNRPLPEHIDTARLHLRPPMLQDADAIFAAYCQDPEVCRYMMWTPHASVDDTRQFIDWCIGAWAGDAIFPYMLVRRDGAQVIGMLDARLHAQRLNIGYVLAAIPPILQVLVFSGLYDALILLAGYLVINLVFGNILEPRIMGRGLGLSTLVVFLSLIFWGWLLGPVGMLLSVPLTIIVKIGLEQTAGGQTIAVLLSDMSHR